MTGSPLVDQLLGDAAGPVDRNGKAEASPGPRADQGVDADHLTLRIEQRTAGVAGVDRGIGLDQIQALSGNPQLGHIPVEIADDAHGHSVFQSVGIANGNRPVSDLQSIGIPQGGDRPRPLALQPHHGQVRETVLSDHLGFNAPPVGELHLKRVSPLHDVGIGEQQPLGIEDHTAPLTALHPGTWG